MSHSGVSVTQVGGLDHQLTSGPVKQGVSGDHGHSHCMGLNKKHVGERVC